MKRRILATAVTGASTVAARTAAADSAAEVAGGGPAGGEGERWSVQKTQSRRKRTLEGSVAIVIVGVDRNDGCCGEI